MGFLRVLQVLWRLGDRLAPLFERLPDLLPLVGRAMVTGGTASQAAGHVLKGDQGAVNAWQALNDLADAMALCQSQLRGVADKLAAAATDINAVQVPTVSANTSNIMGHDVVTGLSIQSQSFFGPVSSRLNEAANTLRTAGDSLGTSAAKLRQLRDAIRQSGSDLDTVGDALKDAGVSLQS